MHKGLYLSIFLIPLMTFFVSCTLYQLNEQINPTVNLYLMSEDDCRTILPESVTLASCVYEINGISSAGCSFYAGSLSYTDLMQNFSIPIGEWNLTLQAKYNDKEVYESKSYVCLTEKNSDITFVLRLSSASEGKGSLSLKGTFPYPDDTDASLTKITKYTMTLCSIDGSVEDSKDVTENIDGSFEYQNDSVTSGEYDFTVSFYIDDNYSTNKSYSFVGSYSSLIVVSDNLTSRDESISIDRNYILQTPQAPDNARYTVSDNTYSFSWSDNSYNEEFFKITINYILSDSTSSSITYAAYENQTNLNVTLDSDYILVSATIAAVNLSGSSELKSFTAS